MSTQRVEQEAAYYLAQQQAAKQQTTTAAPPPPPPPTTTTTAKPPPAPVWGAQAGGTPDVIGRAMEYAATHPVAPTYVPIAGYTPSGTPVSAAGQTPYVPTASGIDIPKTIIPSTTPAGAAAVIMKEAAAQGSQVVVNVPTTWVAPSAVSVSGPGSQGHVLISPGQTVMDILSAQAQYPGAGIYVKDVKPGERLLFGEGGMTIFEPMTSGVVDIKTPDMRTSTQGPRFGASIQEVQTAEVSDEAIARTMAQASGKIPKGYHITGAEPLYYPQARPGAMGQPWGHSFKLAPDVATEPTTPFTQTADYSYALTHPSWDIQEVGAIAKAEWPSKAWSSFLGTTFMFSGGPVIGAVAKVAPWITSSAIGRAAIWAGLGAGVGAAEAKVTGSDVLKSAAMSGLTAGLFAGAGEAFGSVKNIFDNRIITKAITGMPEGKIQITAGKGVQGAGRGPSLNQVMAGDYPTWFTAAELKALKGYNVVTGESGIEARAVEIKPTVEVKPAVAEKPTIIRTTSGSSQFQLLEQRPQVQMKKGLMLPSGLLRLTMAEEPMFYSPFLTFPSVIATQKPIAPVSWSEVQRVPQGITGIQAQEGITSATQTRVTPLPYSTVLERILPIARQEITPFTKTVERYMSELKLGVAPATTSTLTKNITEQINPQVAEQISRQISTSISLPILREEQILRVPTPQQMRYRPQRYPDMTVKLPKSLTKSVFVERINPFGLALMPKYLRRLEL